MLHGEARPAAKRFQGVLLSPHRGITVTAFAAICFNRQYLEVVSAETLAAMASPIVNVVGRGDSVVCPQRGSAPIILVLPKSRRALDGRLVDLLVFIEVVIMPITADGIYIGSTHIALLADIIFNQRTRRPSVDTEVIIAPVQRADIVADGMGGSRIPTFAGHHIADIAPRHGEIARVSARVWKGDAGGTTADITLPPEAVIRAGAGVCRHGYATREESGED